MIDMHVRIPDELAKKLRTQAAANLRSIAAEIVFLLGEALK